MKDKTNLKYEEISIHFLYVYKHLCLILKFCFDINIRPMTRTIEYKGKFFI